MFCFRKSNYGLLDQNKRSNFLFLIIHILMQKCKRLLLPKTKNNTIIAKTNKTPFFKDCLNALMPTITVTKNKKYNYSENKQNAIFS